MYADQDEDFLPYVSETEASSSSSDEGATRFLFKNFFD